MKKAIITCAVGVATLLVLYYFSSCLADAVKKKKAATPSAIAILRPISSSKPPPPKPPAPTLGKTRKTLTKKTKGASTPPPKNTTSTTKTTSVRVAAIQCWSEMTKTERNAALIEKLIRVAAKNGAKIVVTPECALQGYCHPPDWKTWTANPDEKGSPQVAEYAESIPGKHSERFAELARELGLYICLGMIEEKEGKFHNAQVLFGPDGKTLAIHRKSQLWPPGDGWCEAGPGTPTVVDTPYGKLGLMICFELHSMPEKLIKAKTDIVLYSVGWYGPNEREWFQHRFPRDIVKKNKLAIVLANWCGPGEGDSWPGLGFSSIYDSTGKILAMTGAGVEPKVVISNLPIHLEKKNKRKDGNEDKGKPKASARDGNARTLKRPK